MGKQASQLKNLWDKSFIKYERNTTIVVAVVIASCLERIVGTNEVETFLENQRMLVFPVLSTLFGALLGLVIAAATIVVERLSSGALPVIVESGKGPEMGQVFISSLVALGLATLVSLLLVIPINEAFDRFLLYLWLGVVLLSTVRVCRVVWIISHILKIETTPTGSEWD